MIVRARRRGHAPRGALPTLALAVLATGALLAAAVAGAGPAAGQVAPTPGASPASSPMVAQRPLAAADQLPPDPGRPRVRPSDALSPYKQVSIPATTVTDVVFDDDGDLVVAAGSSLYRYLAPGLYVGRVDVGATITGLTMAGASLLVTRASGGAERRDPATLALQATYPDIAAVTDQATTGDQLLFTTDDGRFGRLLLGSGTVQLFPAGSGTATAFYALSGTSIAFGVTTAPALVVRYDLAPVAPSTPTAGTSLALVDGADPVTVLGLAGDDASVLVRVGPQTVRRIGMALATTAGTDLAGLYPGPLAAVSTAGNGGWDLLATPAVPAALTLFERNSTFGLAAVLDAGLGAAAWNAQGTQFAVVSPAGAGSATALLRLYTPPGEPRPATSFSGADGEYTPVTPTRVADTRQGPGPLGARATLEVPVAGVGSIPATNVLAVAVNLTAVTPTDSTYLAAYPSGETAPFVSNVNAGPGQIRPNLAIVRVGVGGRITVLNAAGSTHVVADVLGYFAGAGGAAGGRYHPLTPARLLDTRVDGALGPDGLYGLAVRGRGGVPAGATAVALTVTAVAPQTDTYLTVFPSDRLRPFASNVNAEAGRTAANLVFSGIGADGNVGLYNAAGRTHVVVDVVGYWDEQRTSEAGRFVPFQRPFRYYDSRDHDGAMQQGYLRSLRLAGFPAANPVIPLPDDGAMAVAYNLTATNTTAGGYLVAYPGPIGTAPPLASNLNFVAGETVASLAVTGFGADGEVSFYNPAGSTDLIVDVAGFYTSSSF